jgi:5-methylcytosine-specific restriction endonuclease McrA
LWDLSKEELQDVLSQSTNMSEAIEKFGYSRSSGSMKAILKTIIQERELDISHFDPYRTAKKKHYSKYSLSQILVENSSYTNIYRLKVRLLREAKLPYVCELCGNVGVWNGKPLVLQLDHKDGNNKNHSLSNLRFLCPNCHSQTDTYSGKNAKYCKSKNM